MPVGEATRDDELLLGRRLAERWNDVALNGRHPCRTAIASGRVVSGHPSPRRFVFASASSPVERLGLRTGFRLDLETGSELAPGEVLRRLEGGETSIVLLAEDSDGAAESLTPTFTEVRQGLRLRLVEMRYLLRQFALDEIGSRRGASAALAGTIADRWTTEQSIVLDVAAMLTLGADRLRYTDADFPHLFGARAAGAFQRLLELGVRSNPLLVVD